MLGSLCRDGERDVTFAMVLPTTTTDREVERARREVQDLAHLKVRGGYDVEVIRADDAGAALLDLAEHFDLMMLGLKSVGWKQKAFGDFASRMAQECPCATLFLSRRPHRAFELLDPLRDDVVDTLREAAVKYGSIRVVRKE
jgi:nucleotide-binding universal stress UspA family protein